MKKKSVREQIESFGVVPVIRASSSEEARFAAEAVRSGGIPIVEITMTVPGALQVISGLAKTMPQRARFSTKKWHANAPTRALNSWYPPVSTRAW
jgi:2-keto-3-deoxy-6-phosphogluconate aldolase